MGKNKKLIAKILLTILILGQISPMRVLASQKEEIKVEKGGKWEHPIEIEEEKIEDFYLEDKTEEVNNRQKIEVTNEEELRQALESSSQVDREVVLMNNITIRNKGLVVNGDEENIIIRGREDEELEWDRDGNYKSGVKLIIEDGPQLGIRLIGNKIKIENLAIDGSNKSLVIYREEASNNGKETILDRVLIQNGKRALNGSAIRTNISTKINNSCISNNQSGAGAALNFHSNKIEGAFKIEDTSIINNTSTTGGSINMSGATLIIKNSVISNNKSNYGGAIYFNNSQLDIKDSILEKNQSLVGNGGAIFADFDTNMKIEGSTFLDNKSSYYGGAIALGSDSRLSLYQTKLVANQADLDPEVDSNGSYGGAIFAYDTNIIEVYGSEFKQNVSDKDNAISASINNEILIKDSNFKNHNHGQVDLEYRNSGGTLGFYTGSKLDIENSSFEKNKSYIGGAIYSNGEELNIRKSTFLGNESEIGGGAIFFNGEKNNLGARKFYIEDSKISNNISNSMGGAIRLERPVNMKIQGGEFKNNNLKGDNSQGGFMNVSNFDGKIEIDSALFEENQAPNAGAIKISNYDVKKDDKKEIEIKNSQFRSNKADNLGGAIEISSNQNANIEDNNNYNIKIINTKFEKNQAEKGGALKSSSPARLEIIDSNFLENQVRDKGGALYIDNHKSLKSNPIIIKNTNFKSNKSENTGGALSVEEESLVNIEGGEFNNNRASFGGAISARYDREGGLNNSSLNIKSTKFNENIAQRKEKKLPSSTYDKSPLAGGIYVEGYIVNLENIYAKDNKTLAEDGSVFGKGGVIYIENNSKREDKGQKAEVLIDGGIFENNKSGYGGVIATGIGFNEPIGMLKIKNGASFEKNTAERIAGFLYAYDKGKNQADRILKESIFIDDTIKLENNKADERRFIDGFEGKYEKYEDDLIKNIKTKEKSKGSMAFNNYDINMLGYEYLAIYRDPFINKVIDEVYKDGDKITTKYVPDYSFEKEVEEDGYRVKYKYTLKDWDVETFILNGFNINHIKENKINDNSKEYIFSYDDIIFKGNYKEDVLSKEEIKPVDPPTDPENPPVDPPTDPEKPPVDPPTDPEKPPTEPEKPIDPERPPIDPDPVPVDPPEIKGEHKFYMEGFDDSSLRPNANITRHETAIVLYRILDSKIIDENYTEKADFKDIGPNHWGQDYIATLVKIGIVEGRPNNIFDPKKPITRAEFAKMLYEFDYVQKNQFKETNKDFTDIKGHWAEKYIKEMARKGWIEGYDDGSFRPNKPISRIEVMKMVNRILNRKVDLENTLDGVKKFTDVDKNYKYYTDVLEATNSHEYKIEKGKEVWTKLK